MACDGYLSDPQPIRSGLRLGNQDFTIISSMIQVVLIVNDLPGAMGYLGVDMLALPFYVHHALLLRTLIPVAAFCETDPGRPPNTIRKDIHVDKECPHRSSTMQ